MIERDSIDNLCPPHKTFLNSQNLTGCVLCERNKEIEDLKAQLSASQKRERILREGLEIYANDNNWMYDEAFGPYENNWRRCSDGYAVARDTIKAAAEVKG
jgi:hypothetical protein